MSIIYISSKTKHDNVWSNQMKDKHTAIRRYLPPLAFVQYILIRVISHSCSIYQSHSTIIWACFFLPCKKKTDQMPEKFSPSIYFKTFLLLPKINNS